jgi:hypothetical protein
MCLDCMSVTMCVTGQYEAATRTAMHLRDYEDVIKPQDAYSLIGMLCKIILSAIW